MHKAVYLFLLLIMNQVIFAKENLPTITANELSVDIRVDDDYFIKGGWTLDSTKTPDVFSIGSKWLYETKKVTFTTDIDSITVNIKPNSKYNFIILLKGRTPCFIQIATLANPIFMNLKIAIPILLGLAAVLFMLYFFRNRICTKRFLYFGYVSPLLFWGMTFISGALHGSYNHLKNVISELGAIGTKSEVFTSTALMIIAVFCIIFSIGFYRASKDFSLSLIPAILSFSMPISMIWAGTFTLGNEFHSLAGSLPFLIIFSFFLANLLWRSNKEFSEIRKTSLICFAISMLVFLKFINPIGYEYEGLIQRFFYLAWTVWIISITYSFSIKFKNKTE